MPAPIRSFLAVFFLFLAFGSAPAAEPAADSIDGVWLPRSAELAGKKFPDEVRKSIRLEVKGADYTVTTGDGQDRGTCKLNAKTSPKTLDITGSEGPNKGRTILAIYERTDDTLRVCYDLSGKARPDEFKSTAENRYFLVEYTRQK